MRRSFHVHVCEHLALLASSQVKITAVAARMKESANGILYEVCIAWIALKSYGLCPYSIHDAHISTK